jgi:hypothetical protein
MAMRNIAISAPILVTMLALAGNGTAQLVRAGNGTVPFAGAPAGTIERAYTPLDLKKCKHKPGREVEDYGSWRCAGYGGIDVHVTAGDQRSTISYGPNAANERAAEQTLASFNSEGKTIEWRIERLPNGKMRPFATILRWNTTTLDKDSNNVAGQVLVVTRLGPGGVCHVGYIDGRANPHANELAVQIADQHARTFKCGKDKAIVLGAKGPGFSGPYGED